LPLRVKQRGQDSLFETMENSVVVAYCQGGFMLATGAARRDEAARRPVLRSSESKAGRREPVAAMRKHRRRNPSAEQDWSCLLFLSTGLELTITAYLILPEYLCASCLERDDDGRFSEQVDILLGCCPGFLGVIQGFSVGLSIMQRLVGAIL
jgi:hypothetical protein